MSKISQELKTLLYLNQRFSRKKYVSVKEIADYLEVSDRQARRYLEDIGMIHEIPLKTKLGRNGGYKLDEPLDKGLTMPENVMLLISIAIKRNESLEKLLYELPNYVISEYIEGDNYISNEIINKLETIISAIQNRKSIAFCYKKDFKNIVYVDPYKIVYTNHTYYLKGVHNEILKNYNVCFMNDIKQIGSFRFDNKKEEECNTSFEKYGIKNGKSSILKVKCVDEETILLFDRYFEGKGTKDFSNLTYEVVGSDEHELYYPLFRISSKKYKFFDEEFKDNYVRYLEKQIRSIKNGN